MRIKTLGIIQARMGSTRLPGKMRMALGGFPIIDWVIRRCQKSKLVDKWVLATSSNSENDFLEKRATELGIECFRGSEEDVLSRFIQISYKYHPDYIVRVCADNPFIDAGEIDRVVSYMYNNLPDYAYNHIPEKGNNYVDGLGAEIFTKKALKIMEQKALDPIYREHATTYIRTHSEKFRTETFPAPSEFSYPDVKLDVDTKEDFEKLEKLLLRENVFPENIVTSEIVGRYVELYG